MTCRRRQPTVDVRLLQKVTEEPRDLELQVQKGVEFHLSLLIIWKEVGHSHGVVRIRRVLFQRQYFIVEKTLFQKI